MPEIELIFSITLKSLLIMGFFYFVWHRFVVKNDSVRAYNTAILSIVLSLVAYGFLYFIERAASTKQVDDFQVVAVEYSQSLQNINNRISTLERELLVIDEDLDKIQEETKSFYEKLATKQLSNHESEKRRKTLSDNVNILEDQIEDFYAKHDSIVWRFTHNVFAKDTSSKLISVFLNKMKTLARCYVYNPAHPSEKIHKSLTSVQENEERLCSELAANAQRMHIVGKRIAGLRRELMGDVNILYISPQSFKINQTETNSRGISLK